MRNRIALLLILALGGTACGASPAFSQPPEDNTSSQEGTNAPVQASPTKFSPARPGFYLGLGLGSANIDISSEEKPGQGIPMEEVGGGVGLFLGYAFNHVFALELRGFGANFETPDPEIEAGFVQLQLDAVTSLAPGKRWQPYLAGGIGGAAFGVHGPGVQNSAISGGQVDFGGGLEVHVGRHFALALDYRYAIQRFENKTLQVGSDTTQHITIDSAGSSSTWNLRLAFSF